MNSLSPTPLQIRLLLKAYGRPRWQAARMIGRALVTFHRYCLPVTSKHHRPMPLHLWQLLQDEMRARGAIAYRRGIWRFDTRAWTPA
jgi:hypothetical protein